MKIDIMTIGKIKEKFFRDTITEYSKRLSAYCSLKIIEVDDEKIPENANSSEEEMIKKKEADKILKLLNKNNAGCYKSGSDTMIITLEINGQSFSSEGFANKLQELSLHGISHFIFIIGGSLGLHSELSEISDFRLSFSEMTFPHQLMRVILLEQIYRSFRIIHGEPYHK